MRILVVQPVADRMGHFGIYTVKLCQALGKKGHSVTLFTNKIYPERYVSEPLEFTIQEVYGGKLSFSKHDQARKSFPAYFWWGYFKNGYLVTAAALRACRREKYDALFITDAEFLMLSLALKQNRKHLPPIVVQVSAANFSFRDYPGSVAKKLYKVFQRFIFRTTLGREIRALSVLGLWHRDRLRSQLKLPNEFPLAVIPNGEPPPAHIIDKITARRQLGIEYECPLFLLFGNLRKDKGIETLMGAVATLKSEEFKLVIAGHPMEYSPSEIRELVRRHGVEEKVILNLGYVEDRDVPFYFFGCDAVIFPYAQIYSGGTGPLLKGACTYGRPVIASDVSEMGRLVKQHQLGLISKPGDAVSLATKIKEYLMLPEAAKEQIRERASALARANSWDAMAERFTSLFEDLSQYDNA